MPGTECAYILGIARSWEGGTEELPGGSLSALGLEPGGQPG